MVLLLVVVGVVIGVVLLFGLVIVWVKLDGCLDKWVIWLG